MSCHPVTSPSHLPPSLKESYEHSLGSVILWNQAINSDQNALIISYSSAAPSHPALLRHAVSVHLQRTSQRELENFRLLFKYRPSKEGCDAAVHCSIGGNISGPESFLGVLSAPWDHAYRCQGKALLPALALCVAPVQNAAANQSCFAKKMI